MEPTDTDTMASRLAGFGARIDDLLAAIGDSDFAPALREELGVWKGWIDEARVQSALGAMEGHDRVNEAMEALEALYSRMRRHLDLIRDATDPVPGLENEIRRELRDARGVLAGPDAFTSNDAER